MPYSPAYLATVPRCAAPANSLGLQLSALRQPPSRQFLSCKSSCPSLYTRLSSVRRGFLTKFCRSVPRRSPESLRNFPALPCQRRTFSSTGVAMVAEKIDGTQIAKDIRAGLKDEIQKIQEINPRFKPSLVIFQGTRYTSNKRLPRESTDIVLSSRR